MVKKLQWNENRMSIPLLALMLLIVAGGMVGCSSDGSRETKTTAEKPPTRPSNNASPAGEVILPAKLVADEYDDAVQDGSVVDEKKYENVKSSARKMLAAWKEKKSTLRRRLPDEDFRAIDGSVTELVELVENQGPADKQQKLARSILDTLNELGSELPKPRRATVRSIERADKDLQAETLARNYRIGATLQSPGAIYDGESIASESEGTDYQLRVTLREKRTKRFLPGAEIQAVFQGPAGSEIQSLELLETLGPYHFYGTNINVPDDAYSLSLRVSPPRVGRHADMKERYIHPATVGFDLRTNDTGTRVLGERPTPVPEDVTLGGDVPMALEEASGIKTAGPYRIGFIAELSEPFWVFDTYRTENADNSFNVRLADIPQSANRHLEIVLFDRETFRVIPHADVGLHVESRSNDTEVETKLPFLLSAFYHYGNSLYLPSDEYDVNATIGRPEVHTLEQDRFPESTRTDFTWEANPEDEMESHEHSEEEY